MTAPTSFARIIGVAATAMAVAWAVPASLAFAHEGHQMECSDSSINTLKSDIQAMPEGKAKATAIKEMQAAQDMMQKKDMKACMTHIHNAMEATEK